MCVSHQLTANSRRRHRRRVLRHHAGLVAGRGRLPAGAARVEIGGDVHAARFDVDRDLIAVLHERDRAAHLRLGRDVAGHEAVGGAREAPGGQQHDAVVQPLADQRARHAQHLPHPGAALRSLVADDDHVARLDLAALHRREARLLGVEHARRAGVLAAIVARQLHDRAIRRQRPAQDREAAPR